MAGLMAPDTGRVLLGDTVLAPANVDRLRRRIGYMIQEGGLFPHLSARDNITLVARYLRWESGRIAARLDELSELGGLEPSLLARHPRDLSGGQRQRVALMRALMLDPDLLLLDEPLGALDPVTRRGLQTELKAIFARLGKTVVLVTHDMGEAAWFAEHIVLLRDGAIVQRGSLRELREQPATTYVSEFISAQRSPLDALGASLQ
jgi:osmoprotectant transport system ATP-binding protein